MIIENKIEHFSYPNGEYQDVQVVTLSSFRDLDFFFPEYDPQAFQALCDLYRDYIVPVFPWFFEELVLFTLPETEIPSLPVPSGYGEVYDPLTRVNIAFREHCFLKDEKILFDDEKTGEFFQELKARRLLKIVKGKRKKLRFLPVGRSFGFLSGGENASLKVNANFFLMDKLDLGSVYDVLSTPVGFSVKEGKILFPPLFDREILMVDCEGKVFIGKKRLEEITVRIDGKAYRHGQNAEFYSRPSYKRSPKGGHDLILTGKRIVAYKEGGESEVPSSGFVLKTKEKILPRNLEAEYGGAEDLSFALQVGNSVMIDGKKSERFLSPFYHFLDPFAVSYPPSMYPLNFKKDRAPRIVLGNDKDGQIKLLWLEGAGKSGYRKGEESCGASLSETADIAEKLGLQNAVHLDGGGSAQILLQGKRALKLSARGPSFEEKERAIALGLIVR